MIGRFLRQDRFVQAVLKSLDLDPDPSSLGADPAEFSFLARMVVGQPDAPGGESFDVTVCSPEWLAAASQRVGGVYSARHHLVVSVEQFDVRALRAWLEARMQEARASTWPEIGERLGRLALWEFED